jgi:DNA-binding CsgD family transcriptional regulator
LTLASSLQPLWHARGRLREGLGWFDTVLADDDAQRLEGAGAVRSRALADRALLATWADGADSLGQAQQALAIARDLDDPDLLARALSACGYIAAYTSSEAAQGYFDEALGPVRASGDRWRLSQILASQAAGAILAGYPIAAQAAAEEGRDLADAIGERFTSRRCRMALGLALAARGDLPAASAQLREVAAEAEAAHDQICRADSLAFQGVTLAYQGDTGAAGAAAEAAVEAAAELGGLKAGAAYIALAAVALADGDAELARQATEDAPYRGALPQVAARRVIGVEVELACGKLLSARRWADEVIATATGVWLAWALTSRARLAIAQGEPDSADHDAHDALAIAAEVQGYQCVPDILEQLGNLAIADGSSRGAARLFGAAYGSRQRMGAVRFKVWNASYQASEALAREALGGKDFDAAWAEGAALSTEEAIAYAQRGRGPRKRPAIGWASLTPAERDVVRLVCDGLGNKEVATRLFVSPRTVQTHLTHVYTKLGLTSRVQLAQEASRHP